MPGSQLDDNAVAHKRIEKSIDEIKSDMKALSQSMQKLVVVEERQTSLLRLSEQNATAISELWKELSIFRDINTDLQIKLAESTGVNSERGKVVWQIVAVISMLGGAVLTSQILNQ